jgi:hypothetical protein
VFNKCKVTMNKPNKIKQIKFILKYTKNCHNLTLYQKDVYNLLSLFFHLFPYPNLTILNYKSNWQVTSELKQMIHQINVCPELGRCLLIKKIKSSKIFSISKQNSYRIYFGILFTYQVKDFVEIKIKISPV